MVTLDYRTNNPRWGVSGIKFESWESYSFTLGYLSNQRHYRNLSPDSQDADISLHIEGNNEQGAWDKEGRIHYYGPLQRLQSTFGDLYACSSAGVGNITKRINSNGYILSLIDDYDFELRTYTGYTTADVFPPPQAGTVQRLLNRYLIGRNLKNTQIHQCLNLFAAGYDL